ncbi:DUF418 domain-containing protein [Arenimonas composti]|nr:DUF418 domain-containing protein [Arenimonas composti]
MNIEWFTRPPGELGDGVPAQAEGLEYATGWLVHVLVQGKFWLLFALLFGAGFMVMRHRLAAARQPFLARYLRRTAALFAFGIAHALLLWPGDILHSYAIAALGLLVLVPVSELEPRLGPTLRLSLGAVLFLLFTAWLTLMVLVVLVGGETAAAAMLPAVDRSAELAQAATAYAAGDWWTVTAQRGRDFVQALAFEFFLVPVALGVFLFGGWLLETGRLAQPERHLRFHRIAAFVLLPLGLAVTVAGASRATGMADAPDAGAALVAQWTHWVGALPMTLGYIGVVVLAMQVPAVANVLQRWLAPAGRMALSNYLMASAVFSTLFYGYGFGLWGQVSRPGQVGLVLALTLVQCLLSAWWLARYRFGPAEWLWRALTWLQWPAFRRKIT